jgi:hypothetical protein
MVGEPNLNLGRRPTPPALRTTHQCLAAASQPKPSDSIVLFVRARRPTWKDPFTGNSSMPVREGAIFSEIEVTTFSTGVYNVKHLLDRLRLESIVE